MSEATFELAAEDALPGEKSGSRTSTALANEERQILLAKEITCRCMDCPDFEAVGPAREARLEWAHHRFHEHDDETGFASVERMDREITARDLQSPSMGDLEANLRKTRLEGGGHYEKRSGPQTERTGEMSDTSKPRGYWTREKVIEAIQGFHAEHGRVPSHADLKAPMVTAPTIKRFFPGFSEAVTAAGFEPNTRASLGRRAAVPPPAPHPEPSVQPETNGHDRTLVDLAQAVEAAQAELDLAGDRYTRAVDALKTAVEEIAA